MIDEKKKLTESEKPRGNLIINRIAFAIIILFMFSLLFFILIKNFNPNNDVNYILPSLSVVFFLFGFIGIIIPLQFYSFIYKIGVKMISRSNYGDMISRLNKKEYKYYNYTFIGLSYIFLVIPILINVFN